MNKYTERTELSNKVLKGTDWDTGYIIMYMTARANRNLLLDNVEDMDTYEFQKLERISYELEDKARTLKENGVN